VESTTSPVHLRRSRERLEGCVVVNRRNVLLILLSVLFTVTDRSALWQLLTSLGLPPKVVSLFQALYTDTASCVRIDGCNWEWFPILSGVRQGCAFAPDLFLVPMEWLMERTVHRGMVGTSIGKKKESFTDLDFADDVVLLAEMLSVLVSALEVMDREASQLGMTINWAITQLQDLGDVDGANQTQHATVLGYQIEVVESFTYLGCLIHCYGNSEPEIKRRVNIVREAMFSLDQNIWRSSITLETGVVSLKNCWNAKFVSRCRRRRGGEVWCGEGAPSYSHLFRFSISNRRIFVQTGCFLCSSPKAAVWFKCRIS